MAVLLVYCSSFTSAFHSSPLSVLVSRFPGMISSADEVRQSPMSGIHPRFRFCLHQQVAWLNRSSPVECRVLEYRLLILCLGMGKTQCHGSNFRLCVFSVSGFPSRHWSKGSEDKNPCRAGEATSTGKVPLCSWP